MLLVQRPKAIYCYRGRGGEDSKGGGRGGEGRGGRGGEGGEGRGTDERMDKATSILLCPNACGAHQQILVLVE